MCEKVPAPLPSVPRDLLLNLVGKIEGHMSSLFASMDAFSQQIEPLEALRDKQGSTGEASRAIYHSLAGMLKRDDCLTSFPQHLRKRIRALEGN